MSNDEPNTEPGVTLKVPMPMTARRSRAPPERPVLVYVVDLLQGCSHESGASEVTRWDTTTCDTVDTLLEHFYPDEEYLSVRDILMIGLVSPRSRSATP